MARRGSRAAAAGRGQRAPAERLLLLLHYGVDWDAGWVSGKRHAYWDRILPDYVLQAALRAANLRRFWQQVSQQLQSRPRSSAERVELEALLRGDDRAVLEALRWETEPLLLRVRIVADAVRAGRRTEIAGVTATIRWSGTVTAVSSIAHGGQQLGTTTLLRREKMLLADGRIDYVPVISGNTFRGWLRRVGEDLLREQLRYDGQLSLTAAHALRGGGALAKTSGPALAGQRLATLRSLVPQVGVFGCAAGGSVVNGCLQVGKVVPLVAEVAHTVPVHLQNRCTHSHFDLLQVETFARQDDTDTHAFAGRHQVTRRTPRR